MLSAHRHAVVVGVDGLGSTTARAVGAELIEYRGDDSASQYAYFTSLPWRGIELTAAPGSLTGVFPTHRGEACVWVSTPARVARAARRRAASREEAFADLVHRGPPELAARLRAGRRTSPVRGMLRSPNQVRRAHGPGWALVGDAGYHRDPLTGHGLSDAYRDAELLALALHRALRAEAPEAVALTEYQRARDQALRPVFELTVALAAYPPVPEFLELQKRLARALDAEAAEFAGRPVPGEEEPARV